jgi:hypothetical protein
MTTRTGVSLAKGPVAIVGLAGVVFGVAGLIFGGHGFPTSQVPHGPVIGTHWLGLAANGWTNALFIAAGLLLVFAAPGHWSAKSSARLVALVLGAAAVIAVIRGNGIFGLIAANRMTEIVWGAAAIVLLILGIMPRVGRRTSDARTAPPVAPT